MSKIMKLNKYHFSLFIKSSKFIMPLLVWIIYMPFAYTVFPVDVVSSIVLSSVVLFYIMVWVGLLYYEIEDTVSEQIMILKTNDETIFYLSKIIFLAAVGGIFSAIGVISPLIQNAAHSFKMYNRPITFGDILVATLLHLFVALLGAMLGGVFHPRIIKNRKMALLLVSLIALLGLIKVALNQEFPILRYLTWLLPPVADYTLLLSNKEYFSLQTVAIAILILATYSAALIIAQIILLKRKKF